MIHTATVGAAVTAGVAGAVERAGTPPARHETPHFMVGLDHGRKDGRKKDGKEAALEAAIPAKRW